MEEKNYSIPFDIFPNVQFRVIVGIISFTLMIILLFWVAINEPARMEEFTQRSEGRSTEAGALLFESNCSTCHGNEGYGQQGVAPALNNPQLFGYDFFADINNQIILIDSELETATEAQDIARLETEKFLLELQYDERYDDLVYNYADQLAALEANPTTDPTKLTRFRALMTAHDQIVAARSEQIALVAGLLESGEVALNENGAVVLPVEFETLQATIVTTANTRQAAYDELVAFADIVPYDPESPSRIETLAWNGGLHDLVFTTVIAGRPTSASYWPNPMAAWSQTAGGPLRSDQIENLTDYILNWNREFTREDIRKINQYARIPADSATAGGDEGTALPDPLEVTLPEIAVLVDAVEADSILGQQIYAQNGCAGCHLVGIPGVGPDPTGLYLRAETYAEADPDLETAEDYLIQSILLPNAFVVEGYQPNLMPQTFWQTLSVEELAHIIAYLESFDTPPAQ